MRKIFFVFAFMVALCLSSSAALAVEIGLPSALAAGANLGGTQVYFGHYNSNPILWYVVATDHTNKKATLWTTSNMGNRQYDPGTHKNWSGSGICHWLNGIGSHNNDGFLQNAFSAAEQAAIEPEYGTEYEPYGVGETWAGTIDSRQKIVLPSVGEIGNGDITGDWDINQATRVFGAPWWLRSPGNNNDLAALVNSNGYVSVYGVYVYDARAARPAFVLNLQSVLFTSAAAGGKAGGASPILSAAIAPTGAVKFTVEDSSLTLNSTDTAARTVQSGGAVSIAYTGAEVGANRYVSCVIVDSLGAVKFYGKLSQAADDTVSFTVPAAADLPDGNYFIWLFNEEINVDNLTDFASTPIKISMTVDNTDTPTGGGGCNAGLGLFGALAMLAAYIGRRKRV